MTQLTLSSSLFHGRTIDQRCMSCYDSYIDFEEKLMDTAGMDLSIDMLMEGN